MAETRTAETREIMVNMGPQHPSTHGVLRLILELEGETVLRATPVLGYLHRSFEKICEGWTYPQIAPFVDRNDYLAGMNNEHAYCLAVERLMGIEIPERAEYLRVIAAELCRIASHLLWFGTFLADLGAFTPFLYAFREREMVYDLFEMLCGARMTYSYIRIGGVRNDLPEGFKEKTLEFLDHLARMMVEYEALVTKNPIFEVRTMGVGALKPEVAVAYAASGPMLRGSGIRWDVRKDDPYSVYDRFDFQVPVGKNGDCYDRYLVRMQEMVESSRIVRQALQDLPGGEIMARVPKVIRPPQGEVYSRVESPRGEIGVHIVSDGSPKPYRLRWRSPCFCNLQLLPVLAPGHKVADVVAILGSIDIILGEVDR